MRLARMLGIDPILVVKRAGIDRRLLDNPDAPLPIHTIIELLETAALTSGVEDFGLRLGAARGLPDLGPVILMLREEVTVRDALRTLVAFLHLHSDALYMHLEESDAPIFAISVMT